MKFSRIRILTLGQTSPAILYYRSTYSFIIWVRNNSFTWFTIRILFISSLLLLLTYFLSIFLPEQKVIAIASFKKFVCFLRGLVISCVLTS